MFRDCLYHTWSCYLQRLCLHSKLGNQNAAGNAELNELSRHSHWSRELLVRLQLYLTQPSNTYGDLLSSFRAGSNQHSRHNLAHRTIA